VAGSSWIVSMTFASVMVRYILGCQRELLPSLSMPSVVKSLCGTYSHKAVELGSRSRLNRDRLWRNRLRRSTQLAIEADASICLTIVYCLQT
jgi:hypothetical protein